MLAPVIMRTSLSFAFSVTKSLTNCSGIHNHCATINAEHLSSILFKCTFPVQGTLQDENAIVIHHICCQQWSLMTSTTTTTQTSP